MVQWPGIDLLFRECINGIILSETCQVRVQVFASWRALFVGVGCRRLSTLRARFSGVIFVLLLNIPTRINWAELQRKGRSAYLYKLIIENSSEQLSQIFFPRETSLRTRRREREKNNNCVYYIAHLICALDFLPTSLADSVNIWEHSSCNVVLHFRSVTIPDYASKIMSEISLTFKSPEWHLKRVSHVCNTTW